MEHSWSHKTASAMRGVSAYPKMTHMKQLLVCYGKVVRNHMRSPVAPRHVAALSTNHNFSALGIATTLKVREARVVVPL